MKMLYSLLVFLSFLNVSYSSSNPTPLIPLVYSIWPNFCTDHLFYHSNHCSSYVISDTDELILEFKYDGTEANYFDPAFLEKVSSYAYLIPFGDEQCCYEICTHGIPCLRQYQENHYREDCSEPEGYVFVSNVCCENDLSWKHCSNPAIESSYFDKNNGRYFYQFEQLLHYKSSNIECDCYWPQISKNACAISDFTYKYIIMLIDNFCHVIPNPQDPDDSIINPLQHRAISSYFTNAFFYSHYHQIFIDICKYVDISEKIYYRDKPELITNLYDALDILQPQFLSLYSACLEKHPHPKIYYERGMIHMHRGDAISSLEDIYNFVDLLKNSDYEELFSSDLYFQEGSAYAELGLYDKAVEALSNAIRLNPENKEAYFERAAAYFEQGEFERAISDYLNSGLRSEVISSRQLDKLSLSFGITSGIIEGAVTSVGEFVPSLLSSTYGLGQAIWAFAENPVQISSDFINSVYECFEYLRSASSLEILKKVAPEIRILLEEWNHLKDYEKGKQIGFIVGKYGIDIFGGYGITKAMQAYRNLKRANNLLTFETLALNQRNKASLILEARARAESRKQLLKSGLLKLHNDSQGKHVRGHKNFDSTRCEWTHPSPQEKIRELGGKGTRIQGKPGQPGFRERVDCQEVIGFYLEEESRKKTETTMAIIHYSNKGAHIVPARPKR
ncbi:MAG: polymorphic toxin type 50 domain-containing protein [Chlamydiota bacterium]